MPTTLSEKLATLPPGLVFITSWLGWVDWKNSFYAISILWVALQIYFRLRKEWGKYQAKRDVRS